MTTKYENYSASEGADGIADNGTDYFQTFTPQISHTISSVKLTCRKVDPTGAGTAKVSIRNTDGGGLPTGGDLSVHSVNTNTLPSSYSLFEFVLDTPIVLIAGITYAIVCHQTNTDNAWQWKVDFTTPTYSRGTSGYIVGGTATDENYDADFEEWGNRLFIPKVTII